MIEVSNLEKTYRLGFMRKPHHALRGISFQVKKGEIFGFIGPNGAGKSTTMKVLLGMLRFSRGEVRIMGKHPGNPASRKQLGYLPEYPAFFDHLTGEEMLKFMGSLSGLASSELADRVQEAVSAVALQPAWLRQKLRYYSKGMTQRLGLAQAMLAKPRLLILDEPMSGLDPMGRREMRHLLLRLRDEGATIFYSSHVLSDVEDICDKAALIIRGKIRRCGTVAEVRQGDKNLEDVLAREVVRLEA